MAQRAYLAFDLGAESGRAILGVIDGGKLSLHEVHRFANATHQLPDGLHWNTLGLWAELVEGLKKAAAHCRDAGWELASMGVDTWGVDFGLIGGSGGLLGLPFAYRDPRNQAVADRVIDRIGIERLYDATGIQVMPINTLFQLVAIQQAEPGLLERATRLLFTPDLMHYLFTGQAMHESSIASTSQMVDPRTGEWARTLIDEVGLPTEMLGTIQPAGSHVGEVRRDVLDAAGVGGPLKVIAPASHDTASAVAACPAEPGSRWAYLSSGTWSLMGVEMDAPIVDGRARGPMFTNEGGVNGTIRFLKNIAGLWLVQEVRRAYESEGIAYDYERLTAMAGEAAPFRTLVDPDHPPFMSPGEMPRKIADFAEKTGQPKPESAGQFVRCCLESLALTYRRTMENLDAILGERIEVLHIVGGGGRNELLDQMTADAIGRPVTVGPYEATAAGNALVQAMGAGDLDDLAAIRQTVRNSFNPRRFETCAPGPWDEAYARYESVLGN